LPSNFLDTFFLNFQWGGFNPHLNFIYQKASEQAAFIDFCTERDGTEVHNRKLVGATLQTTKPHIHVFLGRGGETGPPEHGVVAAPQLASSERGVVPIEDNAIAMLPDVPTTKDQERRQGPFQDPAAAGRVEQGVLVEAHPDRGPEGSSEGAYVDNPMLRGPIGLLGNSIGWFSLLKYVLPLCHSCIFFLPQKE
jgi:hypothetical protein